MKKRTAGVGFTLVELIVAISVIGILASIVIISYTNWQNSIIAAQLKSDLNGAASAMESARTFNNSYPTLISNLTTFKPSKNITLTGGSSDGVVYCIDASSSQNASIHYFIDQNSRSQGAQLGTCSSRSVPVLTATPTSISTINLSWTSVPSAASYTLQIASSGSFADAITIATQPGLTYTSTGLLASTTYFYRVGVTNSGLWSATQSATTTITAPVTPVVVTNTASGSTTWLWNAADCATGTVGRYQYDYTTSGFDSGWLDTSNTSVNYTTATDGYTYTVQVKSKCYSTVTGTSSSWSGIASASYYKPAGTAVAADLMSGKTATVSAGGIVGTMTNKPSYNTSISNAVGGGTLYTRIPQGAYLTNTVSGYPEITTSVPDLVSGNILAGKNILGVAGGIANQPGTYNATSYWADGAGALNQWIPYGAYMTDSGSGSGTPNIRAYDANFVASSIKSGVSIFGVAGTAPTVNFAVVPKSVSTSSSFTVTGLSFKPTQVEILGSFSWYCTSWGSITNGSGANVILASGSQYNNPYVNFTVGNGQGMSVSISSVVFTNDGMTGTLGISGASGWVFSFSTSTFLFR